MLTLRRRLASCALALLICQTAAVFAAPLTSCCAPRHAASAAAEIDCCPAGSHPPGQCPRHAAQRSRDCRLQCDAPHGLQFLVAALGVLPAPAASTFAFVPGRLVSIPQSAPAAIAVVPQSPPPRLS